MKGVMKMDVRIETRKPQKVAFVRHVGPYAECGSAWGKLMAWAGPKGLGSQPECLGICYDDPKITPADKIRYDACIPVPEDVEGEGEVGIQEIAGGDYAIATHKGPYAELYETYDYLYGQWVSENDYELRDIPCFEMYLNTPDTTPEEDLLTDIYMPVQKQA